MEIYINIWKTVYERGFAHGKLLKKEIKNVLAL